MTNVIEIYDALRSKGLCVSQTEFSERWLGRSGGYLAYLRSSGTDCCPVSLQLLSERLQRHAAHLRHPAPPAADIAIIMALRVLHQATCDLLGDIASGNDFATDL